MPGIENKKPKEQISCTLKTIEIIECSFNNPQKPLVVPTQFQYDINLEHRLADENNLFFVIVSIKILSEKRENQYGAITVSNIFEISNYQEYLDKTNKTLNFPEDFLNTINSIALSTTRGVMFSQFRGTFLHSAILPLIDIKSFQKEFKPEK